MTVTTLETPPSTFERARRSMIDSQLRTSGVNARFVLERMGRVAREDFVPATARSLAYIDRALRLDKGGWLPAPVVQGMALQEADPQGGERAIVVHNGSTYLAELLRPLVAELVVLDADEALSAPAGEEKADLLLIDGAAEQVPDTLLDRLEEGARIVGGTIEQGVSHLSVGRKTGPRAAMIAVHDMGIPRIAAFDKPKSWSF